MEVIKIGSVATAFIRPVEGVNAGLLHTPKGMILIDTTSSPVEARTLLQAVGAGLDEVRLVINTHFHSDHTWGNQLFTCPILAHRLCLERMQYHLEHGWSAQELRSYLSSLQKTEPKKARELSWVVNDLHITLPGQVFDKRYEGELGELKYEVIHLAGHTPDLSVVWLPNDGVLFASDLLFQGRYPYLFDADILTWIDRLDRLLEFDARAIVPGHGVMCGSVEILELRLYLQDTWERTVEHIRLGRSVDEAITDSAYPRFRGEKYERLHQANIRYMYEQLSR